MGASLVLPLMLFAMAVAPAGTLAPVAGRAVVIDGDTFDIGRSRIRVLGVDAPERKQQCSDAKRQAWSCGLRSGEALRVWLGTAPVRCVPAYHDRGGRSVARCSAHGRDVGDWLVANGWALDYPRYSDGAYRAAEQSARRQRIGVWAGEVTPPWLWREVQERTHQNERTYAPTGSAAPVNSRCPFKGNVSADGRRIVHAPGQRDYDGTRIDLARGERWFCSLAEAERAGWRPAMR